MNNFNYEYRLSGSGGDLLVPYGSTIYYGPSSYIYYEFDDNSKKYVMHFPNSMVASENYIGMTLMSSAHCFSLTQDATSYYYMGRTETIWGENGRLYVPYSHNARLSTTYTKTYFHDVYSTNSNQYPLEGVSGNYYYIRN